ncbi:TspO/MBR family protein [Arenimonas sp.]|uniref:TspO/MBR family protein n=1 Tax=Arenimonas sp. TaxID=1872635 RepID=UPI0039E4AD2E
MDSRQTNDTTTLSPSRSLLGLLGWIVLVVGLGGAMGIFFGPDAWYARLLKPTWNPPNWLFAPVWTTLYALIGISAWLVWRQQDAASALRRRAMTLFWIQLALNLAWTPIFFGLHQPLLAFAEICLLWIAILATAVAFGRVRALAGYLFAPYLLWVSFALILNGTIWLMNA